MLCNLRWVKARLRLSCLKLLTASSSNLISRQPRLSNIFIFGMAYCWCLQLAWRSMPNVDKVCSVNFEPPTESPWTNAVPAQLWLFLLKMTSSWHDLINKACPIRAICYFQIINIKQGETTARCLRQVAGVHIESCFALKEKKAHQFHYSRNWAIKDA